MKLALASAALLGLMLAPSAYAQITCSDVNTLNSEALDDFDELAEDEIDDDLYETAFWLDDADDCTIDYSWDSVHSCQWSYVSYSSASAAWSSYASSVGNCLGWTSKSLSAESQATDGKRLLNGTMFTGSGRYADVEWAVVLEEHTQSDGTHYDLYVETAYIW
jgi:hypothetical protein